MATTNPTYSTKSGGPAKQVNWSDKIIARIKGIWPKFSTELSAGEYGASLEQMDAEFGKPIVEAALENLKRQCSDDPPSIGAIWDACRDVNNERQPEGKKLYDQACQNCDEGWEVVGWSWFGPKKRNQLIKLYGFEEAQKREERIRCRVCWKGAK